VIVGIKYCKEGTFTMRTYVKSFDTFHVVVDDDDDDGDDGEYDDDDDVVVGLLMFVMYK
jgi:hypothetical protein